MSGRYRHGRRIQPSPKRCKQFYMPGQPIGAVRCPNGPYIADVLYLEATLTNPQASTENVHEYLFALKWNEASGLWQGIHQVGPLTEASATLTFDCATQTWHLEISGTLPDPPNFYVTRISSEKYEGPKAFNVKTTQLTEYASFPPTPATAKIYN